MIGRGRKREAHWIQFKLQKILETNECTSSVFEWAVGEQDPKRAFPWQFFSCRYDVAIALIHRSVPINLKWFPNCSPAHTLFQDRFKDVQVGSRWFSTLYILSPNFHTKRSSQDASGSKLGIVWPSIFQRNWGDTSWSPRPMFFFRPTPDGSRQVVYQAGKTIALCKFTELMQ